VRNDLILLLLWNLVVMFIYGIDKMQAKLGGRRIRENTLIMCAVLLGGLGAILGMVLFNHKTSKMKFRILVPITAVVAMTEIFLLTKTLGF